MLREITFAVNFLAKFLLHQPSVEVGEAHRFAETLKWILYDRFYQHWYPKMPCKGSAFRCLRLNGAIDAAIMEAAWQVGITETELRKTLPGQLTMWIDPGNVSYRIGEDGSIASLAIKDGTIYPDEIERHVYNYKLHGYYEAQEGTDIIETPPVLLTGSSWKLLYFNDVIIFM